MIGFLGMSQSLQRIFIAINSPDNAACDSRYPNAFCSETKFDVATCGGVLGSPVFSASDSEEIQGIVILDKFCKSQQSVSNFHSIAEYREWISEVSGASTLSVALSVSLSVLVLIIADFL
jgi:Trypsin